MINETKLIKIDPSKVEDSETLKLFSYPVELIQKGEIVAFPTETVYGLGANALDANATHKIFLAKQRPQDNPLIVHISDLNMLDQLVDEIPDLAHQLIKVFWPGPLTFLFKKSKLVPDNVTCGQPTVAVRMPSHPIARKLISLSNFPIAAPSANLSGRPSPTTAQHVYEDLVGRCKCIIDGGSCEVGLESTVVDLSRGLILRPGGVTLEQLRVYVPTIDVYNKTKDTENLEVAPPTPGLKYRHYSPNAKVILFEGNTDNMAKAITQTWSTLEENMFPVGLIQTQAELKLSEEIKGNKNLIHINIGDGNLSKVAHGLFWALRELDSKGAKVILVEGVTEKDEGLAIMNRVRKASSQIVQV